MHVENMQNIFFSLLFLKRKKEMRMRFIARIYLRRDFLVLGVWESAHYNSVADNTACARDLPRKFYAIIFYATTAPLLGI